MKNENIIRIAAFIRDDKTLRLDNYLNNVSPAFRIANELRVQGASVRRVASVFLVPRDPADVLRDSIKYKRIVRIHIPTYPSKAIGSMQWWLQREPKIPVHIHIATQEERLEFGPEMIEGLNCSGCSNLKVIDAPPEAFYALDEVNVAGCVKLLFIPLLEHTRYLRRLNLSHSAIIDLSAVANCVHLEEVDVSWCVNLSSTWGLIGLQFLRILKAVHSGLSDLSSISSCPQLEEIYLSHCKSMESLETLGTMPSLQRIFLDVTSVRDIACLEKCPVLEELHLSNCSRLADISVCATFRSLRILDASGSGVSDIKFSHYGFDSVIEELNISRCKYLSDMSGIGGATELRKLYANATAVSSLSGVEPCKQLRVMDLSHCMFLRGVAELSGLTHLKQLLLSRSGVQSLRGLELCPRLVDVDVSGCALLDSVSPLNNSAALKRLHMRGLTQVTATVSRCSHLEELDCASCKALVDLSVLAEGSPDLRRLLASNTGIACISWLTELKHLTYLDLRNCREATGAFYDSLFEVLRENGCTVVLK